MNLKKKEKPVLEGTILFVGCILAIISPFIIVPIALSIAVSGMVLDKFISKNARIPSIPDLFRQGKVVVTTRVVLLLLLGTLPLMISSSHQQAVAIFVLYNIFVFGLIILDVVLSPKPENLTVSRKVSGKLSIGRENAVELIITNQSYRPIEIEFLDEFPEEFSGNGKNIELKLDRRTSATINYKVVPPRRGCYFFNSTIIRFRGLLELVVFQEAYGTPSRVEVYPDISSISRFDLMMKRSHLIETGLISERRRGSGTNFESLREYVRGDEFRKIDWKASARKNKLISREFQSEVNQSVMVLVDCSRAMASKVDEITMLDHSVNGALLLGHQVLKKGDKIGLLTFSEGPHALLLPNRGKNHFFSFLRHLYSIEANRVEADFHSAVDLLTKSKLKRSLIMIITDLTSGTSVEKIMEAVPKLSRKHLPVIISVIDPALKEAANSVPETSAEVYRKVVARNLIARIQELREKIEKVGVATLLITPKELNSSLLSQYLKVKLRSRL